MKRGVLDMKWVCHPEYPLTTRNIHSLPFSRSTTYIHQTAYVTCVNLSMFLGQNRNMLGALGFGLNSCFAFTQLFLLSDRFRM